MCGHEGCRPLTATGSDADAAAVAGDGLSSVVAAAAAAPLQRNAPLAGVACTSTMSRGSWNCEMVEGQLGAGWEAGVAERKSVIAADWAAPTCAVGLFVSRVRCHFRITW